MYRRMVLSCFIFLVFNSGCAINSSSIIPTPLARPEPLARLQVDKPEKTLEQIQIFLQSSGYRTEKCDIGNWSLEFTKQENGSSSYGVDQPRQDAYQ
jgi:hypothetical protein